MLYAIISSRVHVKITLYLKILPYSLYLPHGAIRFFKIASKMLYEISAQLAHT